MSDTVAKTVVAPQGPIERPITRRREAGTRSRRPRGRPDFLTSYRQDTGVFDTPGKQKAFLLLGLLAVSATVWLPDQLLLELSTAFAFAIGAIGLNLVTGYAGQVSLGHAFFVGVGAFTAAFIGAESPRRGLAGLEITEMLVWLPGAGLVTALVGLVFAPLALRLRGLYLAFMTLALVFIGEYVFNQWDSLTGGEGVGRSSAALSLAGFRFDESGSVLGVSVDENQRLYLLMLGLLLLLALAAKNLVRSSVGRAFEAVRDQDTAAAVMGVALTRTKILAFTVSSFYAGVSGALLYAIVGFVDPASFNLQLSVIFLAMVLVGGAGTIAGGIVGALFIFFLGRLAQSVVENAAFLPSQLTTDPAVTEAVLGGLILVGFLLFEPTGLMGIWRRIRTYWKGWPFTY